MYVKKLTILNLVSPSSYLSIQSYQLNFLSSLNNLNFQNLEMFIKMLQSSIKISYYYVLS